MDYFWIVTVFHVQMRSNEVDLLRNSAMEEFSSIGIEEFSLSEAEVDSILGERSYSGGDLPQEVLDEVELNVASLPASLRFFFDDKKKASEFFEYVRREVLCEVQLEEALQEDWNAEWKKHYSPIKVNTQIEILPSWHQKEISSETKQISIYPGMGFGTGSHETTFLCLKLFTENLTFSDLDNVLDFGSVSGILGLSSMLFNGDTRVDFFDIDPEANKNCYQNAELNDLAERSFRLLLPEFRHLILPKYDLIFASILENILISESEYLVERMNRESYLILSGLLNHQVLGIVDLYSSKGLKLVKDTRKGDWGALLFKKE